MLDHGTEPLLAFTKRYFGLLALGDLLLKIGVGLFQLRGPFLDAPLEGVVRLAHCVLRTHAPDGDIFDHMHGLRHGADFVAMIGGGDLDREIAARQGLYGTRQCGKRLDGAESAEPQKAGDQKNDQHAGRHRSGYNDALHQRDRLLDALRAGAPDRQELGVQGRHGSKRGSVVDPYGPIDLPGRGTGARHPFDHGKGLLVLCEGRLDVRDRRRLTVVEAERRIGR